MLQKHQFFLTLSQKTRSLIVQNMNVDSFFWHQLYTV